MMTRNRAGMPRHVMTFSWGAIRGSSRMCCVSCFSLKYCCCTQQARGHELAFRFAASTADSVQLSLFGERQFDNLVLLAPSLSGSKKGQGVDVADVMGFIEDGGGHFVCILLY